MSEKLKSPFEEFKIYAEAIGLNAEVDMNSAQYVETKRAFLSGMLRGVFKLTVEMKNVKNDDVVDALEDLVNNIIKELER